MSRWDWYLKAAEQGHAGAMYRLGVLAAKDGDPATARDWLLKAVEHEAHRGDEQTLKDMPDDDNDDGDQGSSTGADL